MAGSYTDEHISIGLDDESWRALSGVEAKSLLRILTFPKLEDRTYSSVMVFPPADGQQLYVKPHYG